MEVSKVSLCPLDSAPPYNMMLDSDEKIATAIATDSQGWIIPWHVLRKTQWYMASRVV